MACDCEDQTVSAPENPIECDKRDAILSSFSNEVPCMSVQA